jgi:hypothetical protein
MYKNLVARRACALAVTSFFVSFSFTAQAQTAAPASAPLKAAFVYVAPLTEAGWVHQHDQGRKAVEAALPGKVITTYVENVAEGPDAERVIRDLAMQGHQIIFTPSFGYMEPTLQRALLRGPLPRRHRRGASGHAGRLRGGFPDPRGGAGHQRLHAGHALGESQRVSASGLAG